jgi:hypothetical protein
MTPRTGIVFPPHAARRVFTVFNRQRRSLGCWVREATARAELVKHPGGEMLVMDEYHAREYGHQMRVVVDVVPAPRKAVA